MSTQELWVIKQVYTRPRLSFKECLDHSDHRELEQFQFLFGSQSIRLSPDNLGPENLNADGFVVQTGDPEGPAEGFIDPSTGKVRTVPLEIMVDGDKAPVYSETLEELGRYKAQTKLPFNAFGTMAMAREEFDDNSGSSQVFWLLKESELTPSNANILDGRYAVFGYVTKNEDYLADLKVGDVIESIQVVSGLDNLANPSYKIVG
ncbi:hypothetical protein GUJ93_ZPchr0008g13607 [Zizania palustris]|uniref:peptidylprolyl isomerase n=1 Tax=Zizania palustris TaxID=103762 RepID=A0A8J5R659_ZIZPA|nr:hypothetical protein GUJ93_ZPchr0008g13607 [Zizania palustris]